MTYYQGTLGGNGSAAFALGSLPSGNRPYTAVLDFANSAINLDVTSVASSVWTGSQSTEWSTNTIGGNSNWVIVSTGSATDFQPGDGVVFSDLAQSGSVSISGTGDVTPSSVTFSNNSVNYTVSGPHGIADSTAGPTGLTKGGSGSLTINSTNSFTGPVTINGGTLIVGTITNAGTNSALGAGSTIYLGGEAFNTPAPPPVQTGPSSCKRPAARSTPRLPDGP